MVLQKGDFVRIDYIGKIKESGKVFDTTMEEVAKEHGIYDEKIDFKPAPIVVGANHVIKGLDEALVGLEVGEKKIVEIPPEKGYGERDPKLIKVFPIREFTKRGLKPYPGMRVEIDGKIGKVQSVGGGRVRVDFNYELAGKALEYEVIVKEKINKLEEKIRLLLELHMPFADANNHEIKIEDGKARIILADIAKIKSDAMLAKHLVAKDVFNFLEEITTIEFVDVFKKPEKQEKQAKS